MTTEAWFRCGRLHHFPICLTGLDFFLLLSAFDVLLSFVSYADFHKRSANNKVFSFCAFFFFSFLVTIFLFPGYCKAFVLKKKRKEKREPPPSQKKTQFTQEEWVTRWEGGIWSKGRYGSYRWGIGNTYIW